MSKYCIKLFYLIPVIFIFSVTNASRPYFQQSVSYQIDVTLNDSTHYLTGNIIISYTNNSLETLNFIWMHLWPNAYKDRKTALSKQLVENKETSLYFSKSEERGYIDSLDFMINRERVKVEIDPEHNDICKIFPAQPVLPGETITISTPFRVKIPHSKFSRLGHYGQSYYITQWYPKPAVYDANGWNQMPYLNQGEFYSEIGKYTVSITLPENYVVASTGNPVDSSEIKWHNDIAEVTSLMNPGSFNDSVPESSSTLKTITFTQDSIHDFAWVADKGFYILKKEVILPESDAKVDVLVYFTGKQPHLWRNGLEHVEKSLRFFSDKIGDYPFKRFSVVDGKVAAGGGMEYPMMTIINTPSSSLSLEKVIIHELCHNWFYGILASNERKHPWVDEGFTSYYELLFLEHRYSGDEEKGKSTLSGLGVLSEITGMANFSLVNDYEIFYRMASFNNRDQPISTSSEDFTRFNYFSVIYSKSVLALRFLHEYLGDETFQKCVKSYYSQWKFRHPSPPDIQAVFERVSGKDLQWFFDGILNSAGSETYKIKRLMKGDSTMVATITSKSASEVPLKLENEKGEVFWHDGYSGTREIILPFTEAQKLKVHPGHNSLLKSRSKHFKNRVLLKECATLKYRPFYQVTDKPGTKNVYVMPVPAWNSYNGWMAGLHFTNMNIVPEPMEFFITPLFDFKNNEIAGIANIHYHYWPMNSRLKQFRFSTEVKRFAYRDNIEPGNTVSNDNPVLNYLKVAPSMQFIFKNTIPRSGISHILGLRNISIWLDEIKFTPVDSVYQRELVNTFFNFSELYYAFNNSRTIDPYFLSTRVEKGDQHLKISGEFNYRFSYSKHGKGVDVRLFAGGFIQNNTTDRNYNFRMSAWTGSNDYLFDELYFARSGDTRVWKQQMALRDGGFKIPTFVGQSNKWIAAINLHIDVPAPLPIKLFFDVGTYDGIKTVFEDIGNSVMYDGGVALVVFKGIMEVYVPLFKSEDITRNLDTINLKFADQIRFVFNIQKLAPVNLRNKMIDSF